LRQSTHATARRISARKELQLRDLKNKTLRGQIGQKQRGFSVGEHTYGYRSVAVGATRLDKKGRLRPEETVNQAEGHPGAQLRTFRAAS
jgi:hypothetical protein